MSGLFVSGTDTGVGKTAVTCGLAVGWADAGRRVGVMKPFESGCVRDPSGALVPADARALMACAETDEPLDLVCPYRFEPPLAPGVAGERLGATVDLSRVEAAYAGLAARHTPVLVEGAGGLLVPASPDTLMIDLAARLGLSLVLVARAGLGTINHTLLSLEAARHWKVPVRAVVLNRGGDPADPSQADNAEVIRRWGRVPVFGPLPSVPDADGPEAVARDARFQAALAPLLAAL